MTSRGGLRQALNSAIGALFFVQSSSNAFAQATISLLISALPEC